MNAGIGISPRLDPDQPPTQPPPSPPWPWMNEWKKTLSKENDADIITSSVMYHCFNACFMFLSLRWLIRPLLTLQQQPPTDPPQSMLSWIRAILMFSLQPPYCYGCVLHSFTCDAKCHVCFAEGLPCIAYASHLFIRALLMVPDNLCLHPYSVFLRHFSSFLMFRILTAL